MGVFLIAAVRAALVLVTAVSVSMMVITGISRAQPLVDPFAPYADVMPGQSRELVIEQGFICQFNGPPYFDEFCTLKPETGPFSEISVTFAFTTNANSISHTRFTLRENEASIGTLVLLWGKPAMTIYAQTTNLRWHDQHIVAVPHAYHPHSPYLLPVAYVAFESAS